MDAVWVYQRQIKPLIAQKDNESYREAIKYIGLVREFLARLDKTNEFNSLLASLVTQHKAKRNFIKYLNAKKWVAQSPDSISTP